ncbi:MAG: DUF5626 family protein [Bacteroidales bacterium]
MTKVINFIFLTLGVTLLFFGFSNTVNASESSQINKSLNEEMVEFDLNELSENKWLEKSIVDKNNVLHIFTVEEDINQGFGILSLQNKTYTVRHTEGGVYEASFKLDINSNKIRRVHSDNITIFRGSISNRQLLRVSDTRARLSFSQRYLLFSTDKRITATITGSTLSVTVNQ